MAGDRSIPAGSTGAVGSAGGVRRQGLRIRVEWKRILLLAMVYALAGRLGLRLGAVGGFATLVWAPTGISLAALLLLGIRLWPGVALGALLVNLWAGAPAAVALGIAFGNTIEAVVGAWALRRRHGFDPALSRLKDVLALVVFGALGSTLLSATIGTASLLSGGMVAPGATGVTWLAWWVGDVQGNHIVAPLLLTARSWPRFLSGPRRVAGAAAIAIVVVAISLAIFFSGTPIGGPDHLQVYYLFPLIAVAALTYGPPGAAAATFLIAAVAITGTALQRGAFAHGLLTERLILLQSFLANLAVTSLVLAAIREERARSEQEVRRARDRLEEQVRERTETLHREVEERTSAEALFRGLVEAAPDGLVIVDDQGRITFVNHQTERLFGYAAADLQGRTVEVLVPVPVRAIHLAVRAGYTKEPRVRPMGMGRDLVARRRDGSEFPVEISLSPLRTARGLLVIASVRDVTDRRLAEVVRARLAAIVESSNDAIYSRAPDGTILDWNRAAERLFGHRAGEIVGRPIDVLFPPEQALEDDLLQTRVARGEVVNNYETVRMRRDGSRMDVSLTASPVYDGAGRLVSVSVMARDITDAKRTERMVRAALAEKETLLKEVHHRVKNNLQIVASLLRLQARSSADPNVRRIFEDSEGRIHSIALAHEQLYRTEDLAEIVLQHYLESLTGFLLSTLGVGRAIRIDVSAREVRVPVHVAVPCGLIINELVTNALKHAFPAERTAGRVSVTIERIPEGRIELTVIDDGVGFPDGLDFRAAQTLGLRLVCTLVEQLRGTIEMQRNGGTSFRIRVSG